MDKFGYAADLVMNLDVSSLAQYLAQHSELVGAEDESGQSLLMYASATGNVNSISILIQSGSNVNHSDSLGNTSLIRACAKGYLHVVSMLVESGANLNHANSEGETALTYSIVYTHYPIVEYLVGEGANVNVETHYKETPLTLAIQSLNIPTIEFLVEHGSDVNYKNDDGSIITMVVGYGMKKIINLIINSGRLKKINVNEKEELNILAKKNASAILLCIDNIPAQ